MPRSVLKYDVNPKTANTALGLAPPLRAAQNGYEGVVRQLLERNDINLNIFDKDGLTSLSSATAGNGDDGVVRLLLERNNVNPNTADKYRQKFL